MNNQTTLHDTDSFEGELYRGYQVDTEEYSLSSSMLATLFSSYQSTLKRIPHCYVFRFRLRVPNDQRYQAKTLINQWFYRLCYYRQHEKINVIWKREVTGSGVVSYRFTMFFSVGSEVPMMTEQQTRKQLRKDIRRTWARTMSVNRSEVHHLCIFLNQPLLELNKADGDYEYRHRWLFYVLSRQAKSGSPYASETQSLIGSFISKSNQTNTRRKSQ